MKKNKFKLFDKEAKMFLSDLEASKVLLTHNGDLWHKVAGEVTSLYVCVFFTGLLDKNGKEIYEGDILHSESWGSNSRSPHDNHVVRWGICGWVADGYNGQIKVSPDLTVKRDFEIIGNIYENPDLLK